MRSLRAIPTLALLFLLALGPRAAVASVSADDGGEARSNASDECDWEAIIEAENPISEFLDQVENCTK